MGSLQMKDSNREAFELVVANKLQNSLYHSVFFNEATGWYDCADDAPAGVQVFCCDLNSDFRIWKAAKAQAVPGGFVSVEDKLPIDGQDVIAFDAIKHCVFKGGEFLQGYIESDTGHEYEEPVEVTHWMAVEAQEPAND